MGSFNYTKLGLMFFIIGMIMAIVATVPLLFMVQDLLTATDVSSLNNMSGLIGIVVLGIVGFIGLIFYLVGYILMGVGGIAYREYGDKHRKFLLISLIILIITIILTVIQVIIQMMAVGGAASTKDLSGLVIIYYTPIITAIIGGLFYLFLLHELEDIKGKIILYLYYGITIAIASSIAFLNISNFATWREKTLLLINDTSMSGTFMGMDFGTLNAQNTINQAISIEATKYAAYGSIPSIFLFVALVLAYLRINKGVLKPIP